MKQQKDALTSVSKQLSLLNKTLALRNSLQRRFLLGIVFGLGTALGATVIATILILLIASFVEATGLEMMIGSEAYQQLFETTQ